jgi:hypothetical protein
VLASRNLYFHNPIVSHNPLIYFRAGLLRRVRERARDGEGDLPRFPAASFDGVLQAKKKKTSIFVLCVSLTLSLCLSLFSVSLLSLSLSPSPSVLAGLRGGWFDCRRARCAPAPPPAPPAFQLCVCQRVDGMSGGSIARHYQDT